MTKGKAILNRRHMLGHKIPIGAKTAAGEDQVIAGDGLSLPVLAFHRYASNQSIFCEYRFAFGAEKKFDPVAFATGTQPVDKFDP